MKTTTKPRYYHATADEARRLREGTQTVLVMPVNFRNAMRFHNGIPQEAGTTIAWKTISCPVGCVGDVFGVKVRSRSPGGGQSQNVIMANQKAAEAAIVYCRVQSVEVVRWQSITAKQWWEVIGYKTDDWIGIRKDWDRRHQKHPWASNPWAWVVGVERVEKQ